MATEILSSHRGSLPEGPPRAVPGTMAPPESALTEMVPNDRFRTDGRPVGDLRDELYRVPNLANVGHTFGIWIQSVGVIALAAWWGNPIGWVIAFLMCCRAMVRFAILMHESAHRLLFSNRRWNDRVGKWLVAYPAFVPIDAYRRVHMAHHKEEFGPREPDMALYSGYPLPADSWRRKLTRDATGNSGWKNLKGLLTGFKAPGARKVVAQIWGVQVVMFALLWVVGGHWWVWPMFWLLPWMTAWRVLNRLRAVAEHAGLKASADRRETTHHVRQSAIAKFIFVPFNTGYHLGHHVDIGVPFSSLPKFERELREVGYIQPELEWPSYLALWRHARSGAAASASGASA
jgi:fatty acid desaturase